MNENTSNLNNDKSDDKNKNNNAADAFMQKHEDLIEKLKACYAKDSESYLEQCKHVVELHKRATKDDTLDELYPLLEKIFDIRKSTAKNMLTMNDFWNVKRPKLAKVLLPDYFNSGGCTNIVRGVNRKVQKDKKPTKDFGRFVDLIVEKEGICVQLCNPEELLDLKEKTEREWRDILAIPRKKGGKGKQSDEMHSKYKTYGALLKAYRSMEAEVERLRAAGKTLPVTEESVELSESNESTNPFLLDDVEQPTEKFDDDLKVGGADRTTEEDAKDVVVSDDNQAVSREAV